MLGMRAADDNPRPGFLRSGNVDFLPIKMDFLAIVVLAIFFAIWLGFAIFSRLKQWSWVASIGGGFFLSCTVLALGGTAYSILTDQTWATTEALVEEKLSVKNLSFPDVSYLSSPLLHCQTTEQVIDAAEALQETNATIKDFPYCSRTKVSEEIEVKIDKLAKFEGGRFIHWTATNSSASGWSYNNIRAYGPKVHWLGPDGVYCQRPRSTSYYPGKLLIPYMAARLNNDSVAIEAFRRNPPPGCGVVPPGTYYPYSWLARSSVWLDGGETSARITEGFLSLGNGKRIRVSTIPNDITVKSDSLTAISGDLVKYGQISLLSEITIDHLKTQNAPERIAFDDSMN